MGSFKNWYLQEAIDHGLLGVKKNSSHTHTRRSCNLLGDLFKISPGLFCHTCCIYNYYLISQFVVQS